MKRREFLFYSTIALPTISIRKPWEIPKVQDDIKEVKAEPVPVKEPVLLKTLEDSEEEDSTNLNIWYEEFQKALKETFPKVEIVSNDCITIIPPGETLETKKYQTIKMDEWFSTFGLKDSYCAFFKLTRKQTREYFIDPVISYYKKEFEKYTYLFTRKQYEPHKGFGEFKINNKHFPFTLHKFYDPMKQQTCISFRTCVGGF